MIVDASALLAVAFGEPEAGRFADVITREPGALMAAPSWVEAAITIARRGGAVALLDRLADELGITLRPFTPEHARAALSAFAAFGKGRHGAALNYGDCMTYAFARCEGQPLLFKGNDFTQTDIEPALRG
ncbi:MAG TPA: type II toxin-antitoxin system VapC family toxin [Streptosporangiaceae bacterium]|nr:type II toxin-antitoxin system VapC family toxin [Streptosporangiaceae bacterium]HVB68681.1 type II toxin-antitoxin system VapC family toxin [Acetobacteraceae bacterium]